MTVTDWLFLIALSALTGATIGYIGTRIDIALDKRKAHKEKPRRALGAVVTVNEECIMDAARPRDVLELKRQDADRIRAELGDPTLPVGGDIIPAGR